MKWAGHLARTKDDRWTKLVTEWRPRLGTRSQGRQKTRWRDDIVKFMGITWMRVAQDRIEWHELEEAFALQWADNG